MIENRPGAGGNIAAEQAAHAAPDGYTLLMGNTTILATNAARYKKHQLRSADGFHPDHAARNAGQHPGGAIPRCPRIRWRELIELAKAKPGLLNFASSGHGSRRPSRRRAVQDRGQGRSSSMSPTRGAGPALQDVVAGHVQMMFAPAASVVEPRPGRHGCAHSPSRPRRSAARCCRMSPTDRRARPSRASTPPPGTGWSPRPARRRRSSTCCIIRPRRRSKTPAARKILSGLGIDVVGNSPREFETYIQTQIPKWAAVIKSIAAHTH